jgi:hypothetical protein
MTGKANAGMRSPTIKLPAVQSMFCGSIFVILVRSLSSPHIS